MQMKNNYTNANIELIGSKGNNTNSFKPKLNPKKAKKNKFTMKSGSKQSELPFEYNNKDSGGYVINRITTGSRAGTTNPSSFNSSKIIRSKPSNES